MSETLVVDDTPAAAICQFIPSDWIACGKTYPSADTPEFILAARRQALAIPPENVSMLPDANISVLELLALDLPTRPSLLAKPEAQRSFSFEEPTETLASLSKRPLPPHEFVQNLTKAFGQAWFSGARSITDSRYKYSQVPLYTLTYWTEMGIISTKKATWRASEAWLTRWEREPGFLDEADHARILMGSLPWSSRIKALGSDTGAENLAALLSDKWLDDELINMLTQEVYARARLNPKLSREVAVLPLALQQVLRNANTKGDYTHVLLERCKRYIKGGRHRLYFPVNINGQHWVPCVVDIEAKAIRYGDSLTSATTSPSMVPIVKDLQNWLFNACGTSFKDDGNSLVRGLQDDSFSCGVCTVNAIEHDLLGTALFTHHNHHILRVRYFNRLVMAYNDDVNAAQLSPAPPSLGAQSDLSVSAPVVASAPSEVSEVPATASLPASPVTATLVAAVSSPPIGLPPATVTAVHIPTPSIRIGDTAIPVPETPAPTQATAIKRPHPPMSFLDDEYSSDSDASSSNTSSHAAKKIRTKDGAVGLSASAVASRKLRESMQDGTFKLNRPRFDRFKSTCREYDVKAEFRLEKTWKVLHSVCGTWYTMKEAYHVQRFKAHVATCPVRLERLAARTQLDSGRTGKDGKHSVTSQSSLRTTTMDAWAKQLGWTKKATVLASTAQKTCNAAGTAAPRAAKSKHAAVESEPAASQQEYESKITPCPGITASIEPRILAYLHRTGALGGGAPSVTSIAHDLFADKTIVYSKLSVQQKETVATEQKHRWSWRNEHAALSVFATACKKTVSQIGSMCSSCDRVLNTKVFRNALNIPTPSKENYKFLNNQYRNTTLGKVYTRVHGVDELLDDSTSTESVFTRFSIMAQQGKFDGEGHKVFLELVQAMVSSEERADRGVGKQHFNYSPALVEFAHTCAITSPELYRTMQKHLQLPALRTLGRQRAKLPPFPTDICDRTFEIAKKYIADIGCGDTPVVLSCDDTKLHAAWRTYYDRDKDCHYLVGGTGPPRAVADIDELRKALNEAGDKDKATKLRLWCIQPTLPKVPPLIIAAKAIPNTLSAEDLYSLLLLVLHGLIGAGINVVSYAADGTETERAVQKLLIQRADMVHTHVIKHPVTGADIPFRIAVIRGQPVVIVQDSKHGAKTFRNNACSGARSVTLGNFLVLFSMLHTVAFSSGSPLYHRDVVKLDRQDDNAATRLYASATLDHIIKNQPDDVGLIVYLFVFGELVDAYQNRSISHCERIKMVLRAKFFLELWQRFLEKASYPTSRYCISREALDICSILVDGLIALVILHRDHLGDHAYPFLPWLHSTEACEHVFGECRKLIKDFTHLDFLYLVPRIFVLIRAACRFTKTSDPRTRAGGYAHTYFDAGNANLPLLALFPSDDEIAIVAQEAWDEAANLWDLLGVNPPDLFPQHSHARPSASEVPVPHQVILPSVSSWWPAGDNPVNDFQDNLSEDEYHDEDADFDTLELSESAQLERLLEAEETAPMRTRATDDRMLSLSCAAVALTLNEITEVRTYNEPDDSERLLMAEEDSQAVKEAITAISLPALSFMPAEPIHPFDRAVAPEGHTNADLSELVTVRAHHETDRARKAVRTRTDTTNKNDAVPGPGEAEGPTGTPSGTRPGSARQELIRNIQQVMREEQDRAIGTGIERDARWRAHVTAASKGTASETGNAANAAMAAGARAAAVIKRRLKYFQEQKVPLYQDLVDAMVGSTAPSTRRAYLQVGSYALVLQKSQIFIGEVLAIYVRNGGKAGFHSSQQEVKSVGLVSYVIVQLYEHAFHRKFRAIHQDLSHLQTFRFLHTSADNLLLRLPAQCTLSADRRTLEIDASGHDMFSRLTDMKVLPKVIEAVRLLTTARRRAGKQDAGDADA